MSLLGGVRRASGFAMVPRGTPHAASHRVTDLFATHHPQAVQAQNAQRSPVYLQRWTAGSTSVDGVSAHMIGAPRTARTQCTCTRTRVFNNGGGTAGTQTATGANTPVTVCASSGPQPVQPRVRLSKTRDATETRLFIPVYRCKMRRMRRRSIC